MALPWLPSHRYAQDFSDIRSNPLNLIPTVGAGPLLFTAVEADGSVRLARNPDYWAGPVWMDGGIYRVEREAGQRLALLAGGEADLALLPANAVIADPPGPGQVAYDFWDDAYSFVAVNLADPGEPVFEEKHPDHSVACHLVKKSQAMSNIELLDYSKPG